MPKLPHNQLQSQLSIDCWHFSLYFHISYTHTHTHTHMLAHTLAHTYASSVLLPTFCVYCLNLPIYSFTFRLCFASTPVTASNSFHLLLGRSLLGLLCRQHVYRDCGLFVWEINICVISFCCLLPPPPYFSLLSLSLTLSPVFSLFAFWVNKAKLRECATHLIIIIFIVFIYGQHSASETEIAAKRKGERGTAKPTFCDFLHIFMMAHNICNHYLWLLHTMLVCAWTESRGVETERVERDGEGSQRLSLQLIKLFSVC